MTLKQSDKIIAIVGVIILIVAAFAIIIYAPEEDEPGKPKSKTGTFEVTWVKITGDMPTISEGAYNNYANPFTASAEPGCVITEVSIHITWQDNNIWGLLKNGKDTLTADFTFMEETKTHEDTGSGNETIIFTVYSSPQETTIEAKDKNEAESKLEQLEPDKNTATFDVDITVKVGESFKFLQPLRSLINKLKDKGNDFDLKVTYTYYKPCIVDTDSEEQEDNDEETSQNDNYRTTGTNYNIGLGNIL